MTTQTPPVAGHRQFLAFPIIALLYTAAVPFHPAAWLLPHLSGANLFDRFLCGPILICALYFQYRLSTITSPTLICIANPSGSDTYIRDGKVSASPRAQNLFEFVYNPRMYYVYMGAEVGLLLFAEFAGFEYLRRGIVAGVLAALWAVGWTVTPRSTKMWAWGHIKAIWFFIVLDLVRDLGGFGGGYAQRRRRR